MVVQIHGMTPAVCPQRVMHCLIEKGVEFEIIHVDLEKGEHKTPEYMAKQVILLFIYGLLNLILSQTNYIFPFFWTFPYFCSLLGKSPTLWMEISSSMVRKSSAKECRNLSHKIS